MRLELAECLRSLVAKPSAGDSCNFALAPFDAYAVEVARVDTNGDGVISAAEGDVDTASDGSPNNERLFIPATQFNRFAVTHKINDGLLAPRFAPSQKAWVVSCCQEA